MSRACLLLLVSYMYIAAAGAAVIFPIAQADEKLGRLEQQISELKVSVSNLKIAVKRLQAQRASRSDRVSCKPNWIPIYLNSSLTFCVFASAHSLPWDKAKQRCKSQDSRLLGFGGEITQASQLEAAVRRALSFERLRGSFWLGLQHRSSAGMAWSDGSEVGLRRWNWRVIRFITQPCGTLWLNRMVWDFDDCRSSNRWLCIRRPQG